MSEIQWMERKFNPPPGRPPMPGNVVEIRISGKKEPKVKVAIGKDVLQAMKWRSGYKIQTGIDGKYLYFRKHTLHGTCLQNGRDKRGKNSDQYNAYLDAKIPPASIQAIKPDFEKHLTCKSWVVEDGILKVEVC